MKGFLLSDDLMFTSRITATARALKLEMTTFRDSATLLTSAQQTAPACVLVDLHNPGLDALAFVQSLRSQGNPTIVAFGSHVDSEALKAAQAAGCDLVLPRSKFVEMLERDLARWFTTAPPPPTDRGLLQ